uniref:Homeobox domain-containing protein n=1 Tax=Knipowitschia caucasica TaxID=637954 RepID=A0AAV2MKW3_KNICA
MDTWDQRRGLQSMNLRSVFTIEQQRILERYYDNGMTNQSKSCFQLILQCAQEAKLDFSVVRTWVGNKRRKLASKVDQNGGLSVSLSGHSLSAGLLSNHSFPAGTLPNPSLVPGPLLHSEVLTARSIPNRGSGQRVQEKKRPAPVYLDTSYNFSIAMETGDEEDEWLREEEMANMAAQAPDRQRREQRSQSVTEVSGTSRSSNIPAAANSKSTAAQGDSDLHSYEAVAAQTSLRTDTSSQTSVSASADPWILNNSRKRTLQDRTQFSDGDLLQLKRYWDRGMTSLGSVCKDKINAAANELNVDTEIVKTWISNRRRKYRLMGIEIPPPKGGPAVFTTSSPGNESPVALSPDVDRLQTPDLTDDTNDGLSEDGTISSQNRDGEDDTDMSTAPLKIEVCEDDEEVNDDGVNMMASDLEQMQSLLEFKHEEVEFLENELENQKQRYQELASYTKSLLIAVRNKDLDKQQELIDSLPLSSDRDWDVEEDVENLASPSAHENSEHEQSPSCGGNSPLTNEDINAHTFTEPSASEGNKLME